MLPVIDATETTPEWLDIEGVAWKPGGTVHHIFGTEGLFPAGSPQAGLTASVMTLSQCDPEASTASSPASVQRRCSGRKRPGCCSAISFSALFAGFVTRKAKMILKQYFSFEARLRRNLTAERIICTYQAVLDTRTGQISGCEVLTRWRDLDDTVVYPDRFLPVLENDQRMMEFTRLVVDKAYAELTEVIAPGANLNVSFNISPHDLAHPSCPCCSTGSSTAKTALPWQSRSWKRTASISRWRNG